MKYLIAAMLLVGFLTTGHLRAENVMMVRSYDSFAVAQDAVTKSLESHGYTVAHVQRCDGGLTGFGYETDLYRVLFFGKPDEVRQWSKKVPELIPYLPLKIALIAEDDQVLISSFNPEELGQMFTDRQLQIQFSRWKNDIESVMREVSGRASVLTARAN